MINNRLGSFAYLRGLGSDFSSRLGQGLLGFFKFLANLLYFFHARRHSDFSLPLGHKSLRHIAQVPHIFTGLTCNFGQAARSKNHQSNNKNKKQFGKPDT